MRRGRGARVRSGALRVERTCGPKVVTTGGVSCDTGRGVPWSRRSAPRTRRVQCKSFATQHFSTALSQAMDVWAAERVSIRGTGMIKAIKRQPPGHWTSEATLCTTARPRCTEEGHGLNLNLNVQTRAAQDDRQIDARDQAIGVNTRQQRPPPPLVCHRLVATSSTSPLRS